MIIIQHLLFINLVLAILVLVEGGSFQELLARRRTATNVAKEVFWLLLLLDCESRLGRRRIYRDKIVREGKAIIIC